MVFFVALANTVFWIYFGSYLCFCLFGFYCFARSHTFIDTTNSIVDAVRYLIKVPGSTPLIEYEQCNIVEIIITKYFFWYFFFLIFVLLSTFFNCSSNQVEFYRIDPFICQNIQKLIDEHYKMNVSPLHLLFILFRLRLWSHNTLPDKPYHWNIFQFHRDSPRVS